MPHSSHSNAPDAPLSDSAKTQPSRQDNPFLRYLYLLIALGGLTYAGLGFVSLSEATQNESWPRIEGQILSNSVKEYERKKSDGSPLTTYQASVQYQYEIDGVSYQGSALSLHPAERTLKGVAQTELEPYPVGTKVMVYYNPADPNQAVLRSSDTVGAFQAISAGLCIGLVCLVLFFISKRRLAD